MFRILLWVSAFLIPTSVLTATTYELIAPIGSLTSVPITLKDYLEGAFQTIIGIAGILAVLMLVICGIKLMGTGSVAAKSEAKQCIWNAIFGLLLAVGSWILLNTINPLLLKNDAQITVQTPAAPTIAAPTGNDPMPTIPGWYFRFKDVNGIIKNSLPMETAAACLEIKNEQESNSPGSIQPVNGLDCWEITKAPPAAGETSTRNSICGNDSCVSNSSTNVYINTGPCPSVGSKGCTNVAGLPGSVVSVVKSLAGTCNCKVTISGGTEYWLHKTHQANKPIFDLRKSTAVDNAIKSADPSSRRASFMNYEWLYNNFWFTDEGDHWHVCEVGTAVYKNGIQLTGTADYCRPK